MTTCSPPSQRRAGTPRSGRRCRLSPLLPWLVATFACHDPHTVDTVDTATAADNAAHWGGRFTVVGSFLGRPEWSGAAGFFRDDDDTDSDAVLPPLDRCEPLQSTFSVPLSGGDATDSGTLTYRMDGEVIPADDGGIHDVGWVPGAVLSLSSAGDGDVPAFDLDVFTLPPLLDIVTEIRPDGGFALSWTPGADEDTVSVTLSWGDEGLHCDLADDGAFALDPGDLAGPIEDLEYWSAIRWHREQTASADGAIRIDTVSMSVQRD
ncbi:MAG: hypothetical protein R3F59_25550 [Myxococcota bacterium]